MTSGLRRKKMPLVDEVDYGETVSTRFLLNVFSSASYSAQVSIIYYLNINSASPSDSNLVYSTIISQHTYEKEGSKEGGRYNRNVRW